MTEHSHRFWFRTGRWQNIDDDRDAVIPSIPFTESGCMLKGRKDADGRISPREFPEMGVCRVKASSGYLRIAI